MKEKISFHFFTLTALFAIGSVFSNDSDPCNGPQGSSCSISNFNCIVKNPGSAIWCNNDYYCPPEYPIRATGGNIGFCYKTRPECQAQNSAQADWACDECPFGSYQITCPDCSCKEGEMSCSCSKGWNSGDNTTLDYQICDKEIHNCDGTLTCGDC